MSGETFTIEVLNWEKFQHYDPAIRTPPWIKVYCRLLDDENYLGLTEHQAIVLHRLWLTYAAHGCHSRVTGPSPSRHLHVTTASLSRHLHVRVMTRDLEALNHAGFIHFSASTTLASRAPARSLEVEKRREELRTYEEPLATSRVKIEKRDDEDLSKLSYEELLRSIVGEP